MRKLHLKIFFKIVGFRLFLMLIASVLVGFLDGLGLTMFLPLISLADNGNPSSSTNELGDLEFLVNWMERAGLSFDLVTILLVICFFFLTKGFFKFLEAAYKVVVFQYFIRKLRLENIDLLSSLNYRAFVSMDAGRIQNTLSGEMARVSSAFGFFQSALQSATMLTVYMFLAFLVNAQFALLISLGGLLSNLIFRFIYKRTIELSRKITSVGHEYQGLLIQAVSFFKYLVATGQMSIYSLKLKDSVEDFVRNNKKVGFYNAVLLSVREPVVIIVVLGVILIQVKFMGQSLTPILLALLFFYRALNYVMNLQTQWNGFLNSVGALENVKEFQEYLSDNKSNYVDTEFDRIKGDILLKDISFSYGDNPLLRGVNLRIPHKETVAIVGESGSGKTTLVNVITGLLHPDQGMVMVNGKPLESLNLSSYQRRIGYITQESIIFNDTIFNNVTFWAKKDQLSVSRFWESAEQASIDDFIKGLDRAEEALLGNNGINLSGGQKQRISIARELYKDIDLLIMDEATSALDSETEEAIKSNIDKLKGKYTIVMVAHRLSTIKNADVVVLMESGRVVDFGAYDVLLERSTRFRRMVQLQELVTN
ncbi:ABC transporter ATP-binding protein [Roseivirga thermotolerans]|uniref:ABC transporter ATP-binding protein n=1 Tax=Roseivirga thermotolerans TaxID=1758176 RepID=UPI00273D2209|nr:ABC transporter ATP-binding protein [Roseivirga thermotolerans]